MLPLCAHQYFLLLIDVDGVVAWYRPLSREVASSPRTPSAGYWTDWLPYMHTHTHTLALVAWLWLPLRLYQNLIPAEFINWSLYLIWDYTRILFREMSSWPDFVTVYCIIIGPQPKRKTMKMKEPWHWETTTAPKHDMQMEPLIAYESIIQQWLPSYTPDLCNQKGKPPTRHPSFLQMHFRHIVGMFNPLTSFDGRFGLYSASSYRPSLGVTSLLPSPRSACCRCIWWCESF